MAASFYVGEVLIENGTVISNANLPSASTSAAGIVRLNDTTSSTLTTQAATANAVKTSYDLANAAIPKNLLTTTGDIVFASAANTPARLGVGTSGQVLTVSGGVPTWASSGSVSSNYGSFVRTTTQTNADTTNGNAVSFDTTVLGNNFSVVSGSRVTAAVAGTYTVIAAFQVQKTDAGTDNVHFWFKKNGTNIANSGFDITLTGINVAQLATTPWVVTLAAGDYIETWWWSIDVNALLLAEPAAAPYPLVPSAGLVIQPVGA